MMNTDNLQLIILIGPNGAGKTTIGKLLQRELSYHFVPVEEFWLARYDSIEAIYNDLEQAYLDFEDYVHKIMRSAKQTVVFESSGRNQYDKKMIDSLSHRYCVQRVKITADLPVALSRVRNRSNESNFPKTDEYVEACHREFAEISARIYDFAFEINNQGLSDSDIIERFQNSSFSKSTAYTAEMSEQNSVHKTTISFNKRTGHSELK